MVRVGSLRGPALVVPIEPTVLDNFDHGVRLRGLYRSGFRAVRAESLMTAPPVVMAEVRGEHATPVPGVQHDDEGVLPARPQAGESRPAQAICAVTGPRERGRQCGDLAVCGFSGWTIGQQVPRR